MATAQMRRVSEYQLRMKALAQEYEDRMADSQPVWYVFLVHTDVLDGERQLPDRQVFGPATFADCDNYTEVWKDKNRGSWSHVIRKLEFR